MVRADRALRTLHPWLAQTMPSYEAIAAKAECCRDTVCEAIKALAFAGVLTWVNRISRERVRERDLFGR